MKLKVAKKKKCLYAVFIVVSFSLIKDFLFHKLDIGLFSPPSGHRNHYFDVKPKPSTLRALKLAIWALCLSQPKSLLSMKVEVMNVTISTEEQVASVITDNCQLCWEILWEHFGVPSPSLSDRSPGAVGLLLYCLRLTFVGHNEIENSLPKDETSWVRMDTDDETDSCRAPLNFSFSRDHPAVVDAQVSQCVSVCFLWSINSCLNDFNSMNDPPDSPTSLSSYSSPLGPPL